MKTNSIKLLFGLGAIIALAFTASALDHLKGGQVQTGQTPQDVRLSTATPAAMSCPKCKNIRGTSSTPLGRGAYVKTESFTRHGCGGCKTTVATTGTGRTQTAQATHTCSSGADAACCGGK